MKPPNSWTFQNLDKYLAALGIIFSIILIVHLNIHIGRIIYVLTGFFILISCTTWLIIRKNTSLEFDVHRPYSINLVLASFFFILFTFSILSVHLRPNLYERPLIYFILISLMAGIVALEILFTPTKKHTNLILLQIIIIGLSLVWTQKSIFPSVVGIDPGWHRMFTLKILESAHIPSGYAYSNLPMMHLEILAVSLIADFTYKTSAILSVSFSQVLCDIFFVFLLGKFLFNNEKIGLLSGLLLSIGNFHIQFGWWTTPNTFASIFMLIIIYLLFKIKIDRPFIGTSLAIFFMISLVLTHTVTAAGMAVILLVVWIISKLYNKISNITSSKMITVYFKTVLFFSTFMLSWWTYASGSIKELAKLIKWGFNIDAFYQGPRILEYSMNTPFAEQLFNNMGFIIFFSVSIIGCFYMISKEGNIDTASIAFSGLTVLAIGFLSLITGKEVLNVRWWYFSQILLALPFAISLFLILNIIKKSAIKPILLSTLIVLLSFTMIMSSSANIDNHLFSQNTGVRFAFTDSEMSAALFFVQNSVGKISSDFDYSVNPSSSIFVNYYNMSYDRIISLDNPLYSGNFTHDGSIKIIRKEIVNRPFRLAGGLYRLHYNPNIVLLSSGFNRIYDSSTVIAYK